MKTDEKTRDTIIDMLTLKKKIIESYKDGELEDKRPDIHARLINDIKALNLALAIIDNKILSPSKAISQFQSMMCRNTTLAEEDDNYNEILKDNMERYNEALNEGISIVNSFSKNSTC